MPRISKNRNRSSSKKSGSTRRKRTSGSPALSESSTDDAFVRTSSRKRDSHRSRLYKSDMSGLTFPVPRVKAMLKVHKYANRVSDKSAVFLTSVLEYAMAEILELSLNAARSDASNRIQPRHINQALKTDPELAKNFGKATVTNGGFIPFNPWQDLRVIEGGPSTSSQPTSAEQNIRSTVSKKRRKSRRSRTSRKG